MCEASVMCKAGVISASCYTTGAETIGPQKQLQSSFYSRELLILTNAIISNKHSSM